MTAPLVKTRQEIEAMRPAGALTGRALQLAESMVAPGMTTGEIDAAVEALIRDGGGIPAFLGYPSPSPRVPAFPASICASVNEEVVHGIPGDRVLEEGDILSVDVGVILGGWFGDAARTFPVGTVSRKARKLVDTTRACLERAKAAMRPNASLADVGRAIQACAEEEQFGIVRQFVGHGIGREMHEPPQVPNFVTRGSEAHDITLPPGTVLAVEPMVNLGTGEVRVVEDGWTVITKDRKLSAHFEDTIAIDHDGRLAVLTEY